jgi:DnaK suppressor protein
MNAYSPAELEEFRSLILKKLADTENEYNELLQDLHENRSANMRDTETQSADDESNDSMKLQELNFNVQRLKKFIDGLHAALDRIDKGTYGICKITGTLIPKERLRAVPHTTMSIQAKTATR